MSLSDVDLAYETGREDGIAEATKATARVLDVHRLAKVLHRARHIKADLWPMTDACGCRAVADYIARAYADAGRDGA